MKKVIDKLAGRAQGEVKAAARSVCYAPNPQVAEMIAIDVLGSRRHFHRRSRP